MNRRLAFRALLAGVGLVLAAAPAAALDQAVPAVQAEFLWSRGYSGAGVEIGVLDLFQADGSHPALSGGYLGGINFVRGGAWLSAHATNVIGAALSRDPTYTGVAPAASFWTGQTTKRSSKTTRRTQTKAAETFAQGLGDLAGDPVEVITLSIGLSGDTDATDQWSLALDHVVHTNGLTITISAGNAGPGAGTIDGLPSGAYNAIIVGATGANAAGSPSQDYTRVVGFSSRGPTTDGRAKPDIVAPGSIIHMPTLGGGWRDANGTSFSTPIVAGGAALLIDMGRSLGHSTDPKVVKGVLLNSAAKLAGWSNTPTRPLDHSQGAGQMDLRAAYRQYLFAQAAPGGVAGIGWDLGDVGFGGENAYAMGVDLPLGAVITVTLAWDRIVTTDSEDIDSVVYSLDHLDDLNLRLYRGAPGSPVASSVSGIDNVEHVHHTVTQAGRYALGVEFAGGSAEDSETYGLSWRVAPGAGLDLPGDANLDGVVDIFDLARLGNSYNSSNRTWFEGDFNGDGVVDIFDLAILGNAYTPGHSAGLATAAGTPVPEPGALAMLGLGGLLVGRRRRRQVGPSGKCR